MQSNPVIDFGALGSLEKIVGFLISLAGAIAIVWVVEIRQRVAPPDEFKQARKIALVATAVLIALMFVFMAGSSRLAALGTTAVGCVTGCVVFFLWNVYTSLKPDRSPRAVVSYLGTFVLYFVLGCVGLSAAGLLVYVVRANPENKSPATRAATMVTYEVVVDLRGRRAVPRIGEPLPFRASSGQVNFGCEQTVTARAVWQVPASSSVQGQMQAEWVNKDNARSFEATVAVEEGSVIGSGTITGLDLQRLPLGFTNCPGGGHGELVVFGQYVPRSTRQDLYHDVMHGIIATTPEASRGTQLTLPAKGDILLESVAVALHQGGKAVDSATLNLSDRRNTEVSSSGGLFRVALATCNEDDCLRVSLASR